MKSLSQTLFDIGVAALKPHPNHIQASNQEALAEALREVPPVRLTPEEIDQLCSRFPAVTEDDYCEGRIRRPRRLAND